MSKPQADQKPVTGEYLYKQFVETSKHDVTQMTKIEACFDHMAYTDFSAACSEMVKVAEAKDPSSLKSAKNTASVLRAIFGAHTFAPEQFHKTYKPGQTGYHPAYAMAQAALKEKGVRANGNPTLSPDQQAAKQATKLENTAYKACAEETQRGQNESLVSWQGRVMDKVQAKIEALKEENKAEKIAKLAEAVKKLCGELTGDVLMYIVDQSNPAEEGKTGTNG